MAEPKRRWSKHRSAALTGLGWLFFATAFVIEDMVLRFLFLVTARALPHDLSRNLRRLILVHP
jgi:hypothetical protein